MRRYWIWATWIIASQGAALATEWRSFQDFDKITGVATSIIAKQADETLIMQHRREPKTVPDAHLVLQCSKGSIAVLFKVRDHLLFGHRSLVEYRFDGEKPVKSSAWGRTTDYTAAMVMNQKIVKPFLNLAKSKKTLFFRTTDDTFGVVEATFDLGGLQEAANSALLSCKL